MTGIANAMCRGEMVHRCFGPLYGGKCIDCVAEERDELREALERIVATPGVEMRGTGRNRAGYVNGHEKCVKIAREALDA